MAVIQVVEHQRLPISEDGGGDSISTAQAETLARLAPSLPSGAIAWEHRAIKFAQYCGVISLGEDTIEILPKIYGKETDPGSCRTILIKMLYAARRLKTPHAGTAAISLQRHHLLDVFIRHFCEELFAQLREGMLRSYVTRENNLPVLRGKLLFDQQIRHNVVHKEKLYCQYDELIEDNRYNRIIKYALQIVAKAAVSGATKRQITELLYRFESVADEAFTVRDLERLQYNRVIERYRYVFEQCAWFIQGLSQDVIAGKKQSLTLLFDMNRLFEDFVASKLKRIAWRHNFKLRTQGPQRYMLREPITGRSLFMMKPDISLLSPNGQVAEILDTKWKLLSAEDSKYGISQGDLYQMASYGVRYGCKQLTLIYPAQSSIEKDYLLFDVENAAFQIQILFVDVAEMTIGSHHLEKTFAPVFSQIE
jgi:5-methylcytosine-specific restriction enzyme subunit McrC